MFAFMCRYRDFFGRWQRCIMLAMDADEARTRCTRLYGHCEVATLVNNRS